ncbi:helix-turn-helix domain-containing protein [Corynebacterium gottingense]|uniref:helix-turn-helix domain-containing protein n=1 Tax=Corynebacterium gottingense TaxID=2041036 RepID=UPI00338F8301
MDLVLKGWSVRQITATMGCSHSTVQKVHKVLQAEQLTTTAQIAGLNDEAVVDSRFRVVGTRAPRTRYCGAPPSRYQANNSGGGTFWGARGPSDLSNRRLTEPLRAVANIAV